MFKSNITNYSRDCCYLSNTKIKNIYLRKKEFAKYNLLIFTSYLIYDQDFFLLVFH